jgi:NADPH:quinone reductase-like Zn-dependent oxidoreductase
MDGRSLKKSDLRAGQSVVIHAASGGVGTFAVQLAKLAGARVIASTSSRNIGLVKSLGADEVIDYHSEDFSARVKNIDLVFDLTQWEATPRRNHSACGAKR